MTKAMQHIRKGFSHVPHWVIALVFAVAAWGITKKWWYTIDYWESMLLFTVLLFFPGAVRRLNWRHILVAAGAGVAVYAVLRGLDHFTSDENRVIGVISGTLPIMALGVMETRLAAGKWSPVLKPLLSALLAVLVIGAVAQIVWLLALGFRWDPRPFAFFRMGENDGFGWERIPLEHLTHEILTPLIAWIMIPLGLRSAKYHALKGTRYYGAVGASIAAVLLVRFVLVPQVAATSLERGRPFDRQRSIGVLYRADKLDSSLLWRLLEEDPWDSWLPFDHDWRKTSVYVLDERDADGTAKRLAAMLQGKPNRYLADTAASYLLKQKVCDTIPLLTRYALLRYLDDRNVDRLVDVGFPQSALLIIMRSFDPYRMKLSKEEREKLVSYLGYDVSDYGPDWYRAFYHNYPTNRPTSLSAEIAGQVDKTVLTWLRHRETEHYFQRQCNFGLFVDLIDKGKTNELVRFCRHVVPMASQFTGLTSGQASGLETNAAFQAWAKNMDQETWERDMKWFSGETKLFRDKLGVPPPDWNVATVDELEAEVDAYVGSVTNAVSSLSIDIAKIEEFIRDHCPELENAGEKYLEQQQTLDKRLRDMVKPVEPKNSP